MDRKRLLSLYRNMLIARGVDRIEQELTSRGEAFFHLSGAGHEGTAVLANHLTEADWLHCHYRDRALLVARGLSPRTFFDTLLCNEFSPLNEFTPLIGGIISATARTRTAATTSKT